MNNSTIQSVLLMGFEGCPNIEKSKQQLDQLGIKFDVKLITEEEAKQIPEYYGSPSFIYEGKNIEQGEHGWACRIVDWDRLRSDLVSFKSSLGHSKRKLKSL